MNTAIKNIFTVNLGVKPEERVLVFTDLIGEDERATDEDRARRAPLKEIAEEVARTGERFCKTSYVEFRSVGGHGKEPPGLLWEAAFGAKAVKRLKESGVFDRIMAKEASPSDVTAAEEILREHGDSPAGVVALSNFSPSHTRFRSLLTRCMGARYASMPMFERSMLDGVMMAD